MVNVYDTNDPEKLLRLKRQEADALRDVIRSIHGSRLKPEQFFKITQNVLLAQLRVRKMKFVYKLGEQFVSGLNWRLEKLSEAACAELPNSAAVLEVTQEKYPALKAVGAEFVVPLSFRKGINAWFLVAEFADSEAEQENDLIFIETIGNVLTAALENYFLVEEIVAQEALRKELDVAGKIQTQLLTSDFSDVRMAEIAATNVQHHGVGGDFYDVIPRGDKGFFICIADVAGKGIAAALLMANLQANLRALILSQYSLKDVIERLHKNILHITQGEKFVTLFLAHIRAEDHEIDYINAGHNPPLWLSDGEITELKLGTIPLGILDLPLIEEGTFSYKQGDLMFLYTDGLVEQPNPEEELYGEERTMEVLKNHHSAGVNPLLESFRESLSAYAKGQPSEDDITLVAVKFTE